MLNREMVLRIGRRALCALLILAALLLSVFPGWLRVTGLRRAELRAAQVDFEESVNAGRDALLNSDLIYDPAFVAEGVSRVNIKRAAFQLRAIAGRVLDGNISPLELFQSAPFLCRAAFAANRLAALPDTVKLLSTASPQAYKLLRYEGIFYPSAWALIAYMFLVPLTAAAAVLDAVNALRGKKRGFGILFVLMLVLLTLVFAALKVLGAEAIGDSELPDYVHLRLTCVPFFALALGVISLLLRPRSAKVSALQTQEDTQENAPEKRPRAELPEKQAAEERGPRANVVMKKTLVLSLLLTCVLSAALTAALVLFVTQKKDAPLTSGEAETETLESAELTAPEPTLCRMAIGNGFAAGILPDGKLTIIGGYSGGVDPEAFSDLVSVAAGSGHLVGLRADGTASASGKNASGQCDVLEWDQLIAVCAGDEHTVGLRADGTVLAAGRNNYGQCEVKAWTEVKAIAVGNGHTVGLRTDGTVVAVGRNDRGQCDVADWTNIVAVAASLDATIGLREDGTVVFAGKQYFGCDKWSNIIAIAAGKGHVVGLREDGTVLAAGSSHVGQGKVGDWTEICDLSAAYNGTLGLRRDGSYVCAGPSYISELIETVSSGMVPAE